MNYSSSPARGASPQRDHTAPSTDKGGGGDKGKRMGVLGIGLIMEEVGKGARLVFRYPASPPPSFLGRSHMPRNVPESNHGKKSARTSQTSKSSSKNKSGDLNSSSVADGSSDDIDGGANGSIDLFFDLPARVISKLFRPKRPLCGQPLTLNVSGTTFCCRAELFDTQPSTIGGGEGSNHPLVLFSVIVALAPIASSASNGMSVTQTTQSPSDSSHAHHHHYVESSHHSHSQSQRSDTTFTTIKSIHRNLAKICRVLTREELRCRYVSRQCNMMLQIRKDYELKFSQEISSMSDNSSGKKNATISGGGESSSSKKETANPPSLPPPLSPGKSKGAGGGQPPKSKDSKKSITTSNSTDDDDENMNRLDLTREQRREYVQNLIELMLAASPPADDASQDSDEDVYGKEQQHGNLASELAQIFHLISSPASTQSSISQVTGQDDGVVYINRHIAVPLDPVEIARQSTMHQSAGQKKLSSIRPYHTLLFPNSSPTEVLKSLMVDGVNEMITSPSITHSLRRILPHIQPRKSLNELVFDSGLSLPHIMQAAAWLVHSGISVVAMPVLRKNRYASVEGVVSKMSQLALPFWQTFNSRSKDCTFYWGGRGGGESSATTGMPHIFVVVSALTTTHNDARNSSASPLLGEAIDNLAGPDVDEHFVEDVSPDYDHNEEFQYGETLIPRPTSTNSLGRSIGVAKEPLHLNLPRQGAGANSGKFKSETDEISYSMAVWLIANNIIVEVKDFLVANESSHQLDSESKPSSSDESLYQELLHSKCLDGTWSIDAIQYHFGLKDQQLSKLISFGKKSKHLCVVSRVACPTDDGGVP